MELATFWLQTSIISLLRAKLKPVVVFIHALALVATVLDLPQESNIPLIDKYKTIFMINLVLASLVSR